VRQWPVGKDVNTEAEDTTGLEAVTRLQPVKIQQIEKNCRVCELAIELQLLVVTFCKNSINPNPIHSHTHVTIPYNLISIQVTAVSLCT
jgi:hypothetical protein